ncbi:DUF4325 domain-containing protein [Patescibacteria group bacterium]|nr:DUF4325 domain-containing protein [Patescibacteria group bacterium]MBU1890165.1 DUF4325 domain-containing protein [Patescibacteria group bacterium]
MDNNNAKIKDFILNEVEKHEMDLVIFLAKNFNFSRQRAHTYVTREVKNGNLIKIGQTRATRYFLAGGKHIEFSVKIKPGLAEDQVWSKYVKPIISRFGNNIQSISAYGFTEIFNNAIDHSDGSVVYTGITIKNNKLVIVIMDNGVGIFNKIKNALNLESVRESILHLSKGKFTTDPTKHTGEGIFFTSRLFDTFSILSSDMYYSFKNEDWFLSPEINKKFGQGTYIRMTISVDSKKTPKAIFDKYTDEEIGFGKTIVGVALSSDSNDPHVSRSQAKRLLMGLDKFKTIILDFKGINSVGQAFVDEIFRVYKNEHPNIIIQYVNANNDVKFMIKRGLSK